jgi:hypothetical protein
VIENETTIGGIAARVFKTRVRKSEELSAHQWAEPEDGGTDENWHDTRLILLSLFQRTDHFIHGVTSTVLQ